VFEVNRDLHQIWPFSVIVPQNVWGRGIFGALVVGLYFAVAGYIMHWICMSTEFTRRIYRRMTLLQIITLHALMILMFSLPVKMAARLLFRIKYVWVTPWFNI
ncbi:MAG: cytochrome C, partial [Candidatus Acidiferrales bacterium]